MELDKIYNEDCMVGMRDIPDESIDLVVTDCPYHIVAGGVTIVERSDEASGVLGKRVKQGTMAKESSKHISLSGCLSDIEIRSDGTRCSNSWIKKDGAVPSALKSGKMFAHNDIEFSEWLPEVYRVLKKGTHCYIMINSRNLKELQAEAEKVGFVFQNLLVWDKSNMSGTPNKYYMQKCEFILMLSKRPARNINDMGTSNLLKCPNILGKGEKNHPTEKPVSLMRVLIENSSQKGDTVLDPFTGGGEYAYSGETAGPSLYRI